MSNIIAGNGTRRALCRVLLCVLCLLFPAGLTSTVALAQTPAAQAAFAEGERLSGQATKVSREAALKQFEEALSLYRAAQDRMGEAATLRHLAKIYKVLSGPRKALEYYNSSLELWRSIGNKDEVADVLVGIGECYEGLSEPQKAREHYDQALALFQTTGNRRAEAKVLTLLGIIYQFIGEPDQAMAYHRQSLAISQQVGDKEGEALALLNTGELYTVMNEVSLAFEYLRQALPLWQTAKDQQHEALTLAGLALLHHMSSEEEKALEYNNQALLLWRTLGDKRGESITLQQFGEVYDRMGEFQKAMDYQQQALQLNREVEDKLGESIVLLRIGSLYEGTNIQRALDYYNQALALQRAIGHREAEAASLISIGNAYNDLGNLQTSIDYFNQSLALFRAVKSRYGEIDALNQIGTVYYRTGQSQKALDYFNQTLALNRQAGNRSGEAYSLSNIAYAYYGLGDLQKAMDYFKQAAALYHSIKTPSAEGRNLNNIGFIYRRLGDSQKALDYFNQALALYTTEDYPLGVAVALKNISVIKRIEGKHDEALANIERAIALVEAMRANAGSQENRTSFFATVADFYEFRVELLMQMHAAAPQAGHDWAALAASEKARARSLLDLLAQARADINQGIDAKLLERERQLKEEITAKLDGLNRLLGGQHTDEQKVAAEREINTLKDEHYRVLEAVRQKSPQYAALAQPQPLAAREIQQQLDADTMLLEYSLGEERSFLWAVTQTNVTSYPLPPRAEIETAARSVYELLIARQPKPGLTGAQQRTREAEADAQYQTQAAALSRMLLGPVAAQLGAKRLVIVADGALQYLPFAVLPVPAAGNVERGLEVKDKANQPPALNLQPLIAEHEIVSLPSASVLAVLRRELTGRQPAAKTVAVLADPVFEADDARVKLSLAARKSPASAQPPAAVTSLSAFASPPPLERAVKSVRGTNERAGLRRLLFSRDEAEAILAVTPQPSGLKALDFRASRKLAMSDDLSRYRIIHFATHGLLDSKNPELSGLVLSLVDEAGQSQDGFLRLHEIYNLRLNAELVVLSACQTGLGTEIRGEGLIGLTRGFMFAGVPRVMASLWQVDDAATTELMKRFYRHMLQEKLPPASALRAAQLEMLKKPQWQSPYYWGAFVLQGEWK